MTALYWLLLSLDLILLGLILRWGQAWDRAGALMFLTVLAIGLGLKLAGLPGLSLWIFIADLGLFLVFWHLAERGVRWWLVAFAGSQLMAVLGFLGAVMVWHRLQPAYLVLHSIIAVLDSVLLVLAIWEIKWLARFRFGGTDGAKMGS